MKNRGDIQPERISASELKTWLAEFCPPAGIEIAGAVSLPCQLPHQKQWHDWIENGRHGGLEYLTREPENRANPSLKNPWAQSVLVMAHRYTAGWPVDDEAPSSGAEAPLDSPWTDRVSRYARGQDYHQVLLKSMKEVVRGLKEKIPGFEGFASTDTGPYLEREYAWLAGLGFLGHNQCLIHEKLGSGMFLGVVLTNLQIEGLPEAGTPAVDALYTEVSRRTNPPAIPPVNLCGSCTRCLDACPTEALDLSQGLDANLCLSSWSIEWRGGAPEESAHLQGGLLFGCDICQAVCPWNNRAARRQENLPPLNTFYDTLTDYQDLNLQDLEHISDEDFRRYFRKTPIWRCHPEGMRRNARIVLNNLKSGDKQ
jgi:epoxyqueuosine reductase